MLLPVAAFVRPEQPLGRVREPSHFARQLIHLSHHPACRLPANSDAIGLAAATSKEKGGGCGNGGLQSGKTVRDCQWSMRMRCAAAVTAFWHVGLCATEM